LSGTSCPDPIIGYQLGKCVFKTLTVLKVKCFYLAEIFLHSQQNLGKNAKKLDFSPK
jgi:hypothetical protein